MFWMRFSVKRLFCFLISIRTILDWYFPSIIFSRRHRSNSWGQHFGDCFSQWKDNTGAPESVVGFSFLKNESALIHSITFAKKIWGVFFFSFIAVLIASRFICGVNMLSLYMMLLKTSSRRSLLYVFCDLASSVCSKVTTLYFCIKLRLPNVCGLLNYFDYVINR